MAGEWIKMRHGLDKDPRVATMARALGVTRQHVVGCLFTIWTLADLHALSRQCPDGIGTFVPDVEGLLSGYTPDDIDHEARQPGLAAQMASPSVGWLRVYPDGVAFPEFDVHMSQSAKTRALEAKKKQRQRDGWDIRPVAGGTNVPMASGQKGGLEEEEELIPKTETPLTPQRGEAAGTAGGGVPPKPPRSRKRADRTPRKPDELFDAVAQVTGAEPATAGSHIAKIAHGLRAASPPYTPAEVLEFGRRVHEFMPFLGPGQRPTLNQLGERIGHLRTQPAGPRGGPGAGRVAGRVYDGDAAAPGGPPGPAPADPPAAGGPHPAGEAPPAGPGVAVGPGGRPVPPDGW